jgi:hypothetical protein
VLLQVSTRIRALRRLLSILFVAVIVLGGTLAAIPLCLAVLLSDSQAAVSTAYAVFGVLTALAALAFTYSPTVTDVQRQRVLL